MTPQTTPVNTVLCAGCFASDTFVSFTSATIAPEEERASCRIWPISLSINHAPYIMFQLALISCRGLLYADTRLQRQGRARLTRICCWTKRLISRRLLKDGEVRHFALSKQYQPGNKTTLDSEPSRSPLDLSQPPDPPTAPDHPQHVLNAQRSHA